jgi:uncharacterized membrane protein YidH (DUF202 family)
VHSLGRTTIESKGWGRVLMDNPTWFAQMRENTKATWPTLIFATILLCALIINIATFYLSDQSQEKVGLYITLNGIIVGLMLIGQGVSNIHYKEHYHQMAIKYARPSYNWVSKYAIVFVIFGIVIISIAIGEWFAFS